MAKQKVHLYTHVGLQLLEALQHVVHQLYIVLSLRVPQEVLQEDPQPGLAEASATQ